jgi:molybdenum cofactor guanylyltransferase
VNERDRGFSDVAGVILAGGRSRRMGTDKTRLRIGGQSMLERVADRLKAQTGWLVLGVNNDSGPAGPAGLPVAPDEGAEFGGPLFGILSGLKWARRNTDAKWIVSAPADAPFLPGDLVVRLRAGLTQDAEIAVARSLDRVHPIIALVPVSLADALETWLADPSQRAAKSWLATRRWTAVDFPADGGLDPFFNVNTPDDLATAREQAERTT